MPPGVLYITHRDYLVDEEMGVINVFCRFGGRAEAPDLHTFRLHRRQVPGRSTRSPLSRDRRRNDEGGMVRGAADPNATR